MSFFDEFPAPPPRPKPSRREPKPWDGPPDGWIGGWVPWRVLLHRSDSGLAVLRDFEAFPTGLEFSLVTRLKEDPSEREGPGGRHAFFALGSGLRLGVAFADGRKTVAGRSLNQQPTGDPSQPVLRPGGGGGGGSTYRLSLWLWPLPPPGPLTWVSHWPDRNLPETSVEVDATILEAAAGEAEQLWEVDSNETDQPRWGAHSSSFQVGGAVKRDASEPAGRGTEFPAVIASARASIRTTEVGFINRNAQTVLRATGLPGTDHGQYIYVLRCGHCDAEYGANGSDIHLRRCPSCDGGRPGLPVG